MIQVAEITIHYKPIHQLNELPKISSSNDAYQILYNQWGEHFFYKEEFKILLLNRANAVLGITNISSGGCSGTVVDIRHIFQSALKANASGVIISHNHPAGTLTPSKQDVDITRRITEVGKLLDMPLLDHIILAGESYYSFGDHGLM